MTTWPRESKVFVAGHRGLVGSAMMRLLRDQGFEHLIVREHRELDLRSQTAVDSFFEKQRPELVILAAAKVGGIQANSLFPADFIYDNIAIATNVISACFRYRTRKLLNLGSACIYPRLAPQPMPESAFLTGPLEPTNRAYSLAKIAAIEMCDAFRRQHGCDFISAMPTNLYGPGDNFHPEHAHVLPAMIRKLHEARQAGKPSVFLWGTGAPRREFLHVDDLARACLFLVENFSDSGPINIGSGCEVTIRELAQTIAEVVGFQGSLRWDTSKPDGMPRKLLDVTRLSALGFSSKIGLREGIESTYRWYLENLGEVRGEPVDVPGI